MPRSRMGACLLVPLLLACGVGVAQESASYRLEESTFNAGGHPSGGVVLTSATYRIRLDAVGDGAIGAALSAGSYRMDAGFVGVYPPPGEVLGLHFNDKQTLHWSPEKSVGAYDLYRDLLSALGSGGTGECLQYNLVAETTTDAANPSLGNGWFYLVTSNNRLREEGTKGTGNAGVERPNPTPCP